MSPFIFLHIPKTAGTTMRAIIERQYSSRELYTVYDGAEDHHSQQEFEALTTEEQKGIKAYCGHFSFGAHRHLKHDAKYVTMLRDPVERVISYYHHAMTLIPRWQREPTSLLKFIQGRQDVQVDNFQTRLLAGATPKFNQCTEEMLWQAIENLERCFTLVGISERFDESLVILSEILGWNHPYYVRENVGRGRVSVDYYSQVELNIIRNHNRLDTLLYSYAQRQLNERISRAGDRFEEVLKQFRAENDKAQTRISPRAVWN